MKQRRDRPNTLYEMLNAVGDALDAKGGIFGYLKMKYNRGDKVKLRKEFDHLPLGLQGKVLQVQGRELLISFQAHSEVYYFTESQVDEYLELVF